MDVNFDLLYLLVGVLLVAVAMLASFVKRLPLSETMIYLAAGTFLGPLGLGLFSIDALAHAGLIERLAEIAVIVSLFTTGLKLRVPLRDRQWWIPFGLASGSMVLTVGMVTLVGVFGLGLPIGGAVLLGAILAPTDPVLASDVQLENVRDRNRLRFSLTGEAGLNDGTAFPFVMLGLGLCDLHPLGAWGWKWWAVDVVWAVCAGLAIGSLFGALIGQGVIYLRREHHEGVGRDEFLALGLIALSYGTALLAHAYGFLAVFAAGLALRAVERRHTGKEPPAEDLAVGAGLKPDEIATHPKKAPAHMAGAVLAFNEKMERIVEVALVLVILFQDPRMHRYGSQIVGLLGLVGIALIGVLAGTVIGRGSRNIAAFTMVAAVAVGGLSAWALAPELVRQIAIDVGRLSPDPARLGCSS